MLLRQDEEADQQRRELTRTAAEGPSQCHSNRTEDQPNGDQVQQIRTTTQDQTHPTTKTRIRAFSTTILHVFTLLVRIDDIKKNCLEKFLSHKHELQSKGVEEQRKWVEREVDRRAE